MPLDAKIVANEFLERGQGDLVSIQPMKLQKLLYLAHGWHLLFLNDPLIAQPIEAWKYGPVIPSIYRQFKDFKGDPITRFALVDPTFLKPGAVQSALIDSVWETYKDKSGIYLSMLTHEAGSAWDIARRESKWYSPVIPNELIREEFAKRKIASEANA